MTKSTASASRLAAATSARRDRYVDFLRVASLGVVVLGHWLMAVVTWSGGRLHTSNILETTPWARRLTWVFQVMPVFFIVGGYANAASLAAARRDGVDYGTWLGGRLARLLRPVLAFAAVWTGAVVTLRAFGVDPAAVRAGSIAQPLWFLAVYLVVVALAPAMVAADARWGRRVVWALGAGVVLVDMLRWPLGVPMVGWANLALVWLFAHQLGVVWRNSSVSEWPGRRLVTLGLTGLVGLFVLTGPFGYPTSMVGVGGSRTNTFPPSLALVALAVWQFGILLALRPAANRWLARPNVWTAVVGANGIAMTVYLWHLTAMAVAATPILAAGLLPSHAAGSTAWWGQRSIWVAAMVVALLPMLALFARVERKASPVRHVPARRAVGAAGTATVAMGLLAARGFVSDWWSTASPALVVGLLVLAWTLATRPERIAASMTSAA